MSRRLGGSCTVIWTQWWSEVAHGMRLNPDKCVAMRFRSKLNVDFYRDIDIIIDPSLRFDLHINTVWWVRRGL